MPSEVPKMPSETYESLLRFGNQKGLGLQAGDVAWYPNKKDLDQRIKRYSKRIGITLFVLAIASTAIGFFISN